MSGAETSQMQASQEANRLLAGVKTPQRSQICSSADVNVLFQPFQVGPYQLKTRIVYAPLTRLRAANPGLVPGPNVVEYYSQRARGSEGGLLISEATATNQTAHGYPCMPGIYSQEQIMGWSEVVREVHRHGAIFFMQIWHGGRTSHADYMPDNGPPLSSMSTTAEGNLYLKDGSFVPYSQPKALDKTGIKQQIDSFRQAARNAMAAGFDGVEIHGGNGYLIDQFIKPQPNQRADEYGGSIENRCRFALEVATAVAEEVGANRVGFRLSPYGQFGDVDDDEPNETNVYLTERLSRLQLAYIHFIEPRVGGNDDCDVRHESFSTQHFRRVWKGPGAFMSAGGYNREKAIDAIAYNHADLICMGRHYLANPDLPRRWRENKPLNKYDRSTFYTHDNIGYIDCPFLDGIPESAKKLLEVSKKQ